jgi:phosphate-selective porin OprO and OprP
MAAEQSSTPPPGKKQTLKEFMLKKGMMTEEEAKTIEESPVTLKYGSKGFELATADRRFTLAISGRVQVLYTLDLFNSGGGTEDSSFRIRRAKLALNGNAFLPDLIYKVQLEAAGGGVILDDAYIDWRHVKWAQIWAGQYKVPFNRQQINSTATLQLVDRAITDAAFSPARDIGITLHSPIAKEMIEYSIGIYNGNGRNLTKNENTGHLFLGRIVLYPLGPFAYYSESDYEMTPSPKVGVGFAYNVNSRALQALDGDTLVNDRVDIKTGTVDMVVKYHGASIIVDLFERMSNPRDTDVAVNNVISVGYGVNAQASAFIVPRRVELSGRYAWLDPSKQVGDDTMSEAGGGFNVYFFGHKLKLQTDYRRLRTKRAGAAATIINDQIRAMLQTAF